MSAVSMAFAASGARTTEAERMLASVRSQRSSPSRPAFNAVASATSVRLERTLIRSAQRIS
jgi:hypothetical protein